MVYKSKRKLTSDNETNSTIPKLLFALLSNTSGYNIIPRYCQQILRIKLDFFNATCFSVH